MVAAQSSTIPPNLANDWQADTPALQAIRAALTSQDLSGIVEVDIASVDSNGNPLTVPMTNSVNLGTPLTSPITTTLINSYVYSPGTTNCGVDQFSLINPIYSLSNQFVYRCDLRWNGGEYDVKSNQNGRNDQRCTEDRVMVKLTYHYTDSLFPVHFTITMIGQDFTLMEPRQFVGGNAGYQAAVGSC